MKMEYEFVLGITKSSRSDRYCPAEHQRWQLIIRVKQLSTPKDVSWWDRLETFETHVYT